MGRLVEYLPFALAAAGLGAAIVLADNSAEAAMLIAIVLVGGGCLAALLMLALPKKMVGEERRRLDLAALDAISGRLAASAWRAGSDAPERKPRKRSAGARVVIYMFAMIAVAIVLSLFDPPRPLKAENLLAALLFVPAAAVVFWLRWDVAERPRR